MLPTLSELFAEIDARHLALPCRDSAAIDGVERQCGHALPADLKAFYRRYQSVKLFAGAAGARYRFVPPSEMHRTRLDIYGEDTNDWGPGTWWTICDVTDNNYIALDVASGLGQKYHYIDCFHETFAVPGASRIIAKTFREFLASALRGGEQQLFYLQAGFRGYGDARPLTPENAARRIGNFAAPRKGWLVNFIHAGRGYREFFADDDYGGETSAFEAVRQYLQANTQT